MLNKLDVSVVIPAYNAQDFIIDALESVRSQTLLPTELIIIDDGSTDETSTLVEEWIKNNPLEFTVFINSYPNGGLPTARNRGIKLAKSAWVALLDADDVWETIHLQTLCESLNKTKNSIAAYGAGRVFTDEGLHETLYDDFWDNPSIKYGELVSPDTYLIDRKILPRLFLGNFIKPSSLMFSKDKCNEIGLFNEKLKSCEDREFLIRLICKGNFVYSQKPITRYRWHESNISSDKNAKVNMENALYALSIVRNNKSISLKEEEKTEFKNSIIDQSKKYMFICSNLSFSVYKAGFCHVRKLFPDYLSIFDIVSFKHIVRVCLSFIR